MTDIRRCLLESFGFEQFRPHQEAVCAAVAVGKDVLLVMPTGSGKSLCYQLPARMRPGTALVISPLIALMEDQVAKLRAQGFKAERLHSQLDRLDLKAVLDDFIAGQLDYLFIAPERLAIPGFVDTLNKTPLSLIAVDEAHCISAWGHDFRAEYREIGSRIKNLRQAPLIAMTATATSEVQDDIIQQLSLSGCERHIHGFRRENIIIEVMDVEPDARGDLIESIVQDGANLPAIIYTTTRRQADELAGWINARVPCRPYHAGLFPEDRQKIQHAFMQGKLPVIVATVAFGMGVDKSNIRTIIHASLPSSLENYYQEIGRAGRDGQLSRAFLLTSFHDRRIHEFIWQKNYPPIPELTVLLEQIEDHGSHFLQLKTEWDMSMLENALDKLRVHGAIHREQDILYRLAGEWQVGYTQQRNHRMQQLRRMEQYATESQQCRMLALMTHFGDADEPIPCGHCDVCAPEKTLLQTSRKADQSDRMAAASILIYLRERKAPSLGRLQKEALASYRMNKEQFNSLMQSLQRAGFVSTFIDTFEKNGHAIEYRRVTITPKGLTFSADDIARMPMIEWRGPSGRRPPSRSKPTTRRSAKGASRSRTAKLK